jgi:hypothetical protein
MSTPVVRLRVAKQAMAAAKTLISANSQKRKVTARCSRLAVTKVPNDCSRSSISMPETRLLLGRLWRRRFL